MTVKLFFFFNNIADILAKATQGVDRDDPLFGPLL